MYLCVCVKARESETSVGGCCQLVVVIMKVFLAGLREFL